MHRGAGALPEALPVGRQRLGGGRERQHRRRLFGALGRQPAFAADAAQAGDTGQLSADRGRGPGPVAPCRTLARRAHGHGADPAPSEPAAAQHEPVGGGAGPRLPVSRAGHAGGGAEAGAASARGRVGPVAQGAGNVCCNIYFSFFSYLFFLFVG